jgi:hypothetical protein
MTKKYWVVSPNVKNNSKTVAEWKKASIREQAAFMGWASDDYGHNQIGPRFAGEIEQGIMPGHVVMIARRDHGKPDVVGFGIVHGKSIKIKELKSFKPPGNDSDSGSLRKLLQFTPCDSLPKDVPFKDAFRWTRSLVQLHPEKEIAHKKICDWMEQNLGKASEEQSAITESEDEQRFGLKSAVIVNPPEKHQSGYEYQPKSDVIKANQIEDELFRGYRNWLKKKGRNLQTIKYNGRLQSDGYEEEGQNLIEAKASASRENIRMAVGQLLDYAFLAKEKFGEPNKAMLLPKKPDLAIEKWLQHLCISIIWRNGESFEDNADGQFS